MKKRNVQDITLIKADIEKLKIRSWTRLQWVEQVYLKLVEYATLQHTNKPRVSDKYLQTGLELVGIKAHIITIKRTLSFLKHQKIIEMDVKLVRSSSWTFEKTTRYIELLKIYNKSTQVTEGDRKTNTWTDTDKQSLVEIRNRWLRNLQRAVDSKYTPYLSSLTATETDISGNNFGEVEELTIKIKKQMKIRIDDRQTIGLYKFKNFILK